MTRRAFGSVRPLGPKSFQARYVGPDGVRYNADRRFTSRADASRWLAKIQTAISKGTWVSPHVKVPVNAISLTDFFTAWLPERRTKTTNTPLTPRTRTEYQGLFDRRLKATFGDKLASAITPDDVRRWYRKLNPETPTENARAYSLLHTLLGSAVEDGMVKVNPCQIENAGYVKRKREIRVIAPAQVKTLAASMLQQYRLMILTTTYCTLRFGEVTELRAKDFDGTKLRVRRAVTWVKGQPVIGKPKSDAGVRTIPVPGFLRAALAQHVDGLDAEDLLFPSVTGGHLPQATMAKAYRKARTSIDREDLTFHDLRHSGAVFWARAGATLKELMTLLGHSTPDMALHYQHIAEGSMDTLADRVSAMAA